MIDAHNHLHQITNFPEEGNWDDFNGSFEIDLSVVNATSPEDWATVAQLCSKQKTLIPSFGFHPWKIEEDSKLDDGLAALEKAICEIKGLRPFISFQETHRLQPVGIGETGLDRWKNPESLPWQEPFLREEIRLAREHDLPLTIHCLRAWGALEKLVKQEIMPDRGFLLHAFGGPEEQLGFWLKQGAWFSFSTAFIGPSYARHQNVFSKIPIDRILLETDAPAMSPPSELTRLILPPQENRNACNHPGNLILAAEGLASLKQLSVEKIQEITTQNFLEFWSVVGGR